MRDIDIKQLLQKSQELKALFVLGQRVIPFLEEMFRFIEEISPLLDVINTSIEDNLQKMPKASMQLSKVSEATELATTEIMDTLDGLVLKSNTISTNLKKLSGQVGTQTAGTPEGAESTITESENLLNSIREDANTIIMALQIQDITSQQLAAVNHLLETVQKRLSEIMKEFRDPDSEAQPDESSSKLPTNVSHLHRSIAFDTNAIDSLNKSHGSTRQDKVDSIFNVADAAQKKEGSNVVSSQDDIDALFGAPSQHKKSDDTGVSSQDDIDALFGAPSQHKKSDDTDVSSQNDIDALFGASSKPAPPPATTSSPKKDASHSGSGGVSQDDIDALFNNPT